MLPDVPGSQKASKLRGIRAGHPVVALVVVAHRALAFLGMRVAASSI